MEAYETLGILGEGTYGVVVKARSRITGKLVAIKRFKQTEQDEHVRKTSTREVRMLQLLRHPNVIRLEDVFRREGKLYLVFEFVSNTILQLLENTARGLSRRELRRYTYQLLRGIEFCHRNNVIHRDVKPENVLIDESGLLKLCDFGFARQMSAKGKYTDYVATRWYRAPELLVGDVAYGKPVDVWALGCMFAELSDGQPLFPGESDLDQLCLILQTCGPVPVRMVLIFEHNPLYNGISFPHSSIVYTLKERYHRESDDWLQLLNSCLQPDPAQRLTCTELMELPYFTRDGFRDRYEAELRAATGLPQLRSTAMASMPLTWRRAPDQAASVGGDLKTDTVKSPNKRLSREAVAPKLQGHKAPVANNKSPSDAHLTKVTPEAVRHDAHITKGKPVLAPTPMLPRSPTPVPEHSVQLPMILNSNPERAVVVALTDDLHQTPASSSPATSSPMRAPPTKGAEGLATADVLDYPGRAVSPFQTSLISDPPATRDQRKGNSNIVEVELHRRSSVISGNGTACAVPTGGDRNEPAKGIGDHPVASATLPPSGVHAGSSSDGPGDESETANVSSLLTSHGAADSDARLVPSTAAPGRDGGEAAVPARRASKPMPPSTPVATAISAFSSPFLGITHFSLAECLRELSAPSLQLSRQLEQEQRATVAEQSQSHTPPSTEASILSFRVRTHNPLAPPSSENDGGCRSKSDIEAPAPSVAKARRGLSNSSASTAASAAHAAGEVKRRKVSRQKRDASRAQDQAVEPVGGGALRRPVLGHATGEDAYRTGITPVGNPSRPGASLSLSYLLGQQQQQQLPVPEPSGTHTVGQHMRSVGSDPSRPDSTHHRSVDARGSVLRKERRSKPLASSTYAPQGSAQRHRQQLQPRVDGALQPDGGASRRTTATLLALSALRNVSGLPPTKSTDEAGKYTHSHHTRSHANSNGSETMSSVGGGDGSGTNTSTTGRARRSFGMSALRSNSRDSDEVEATRRALKKNLIVTHGRSSNGAASDVSCTDKSLPSYYQVTSGINGALYRPFTKTAKVDGEAGEVQQRQTLRKLKKKVADSGGSGIANLISSNSPSTSVTTGRPLQHQQQLAKEEGGNGDGTAHQFNAATAAFSYTNN
ncbi:hypothetical protein GH5_03311 [Leishmania sp. Ghana 2012 LV757]|uniref:hypothetical protein n=1 Tax=Leishmania sp. Ghana 2012 LV757 TaxID=2803181 RepID=UPI001B5BDDAC|nr:hypothetical protein GH5_03311 [Leishmania sp. Ghana 2012 LV757]